MPLFTTISPTCEPRGKPAVWNRFRDGGYIAVGWCYDVDLTGKTIGEIRRLIPETSANDRDEQDGLRSFPIFWELCRRGELGCGDYVAVRNGNDGLFGVGIIRSGYKYSRYKHDTGVIDHYYPHFVDVEWVWNEYIRRRDLDFGDGRSWPPYGTINKLSELPAYIRPYCKPIRLPEEVAESPALYEGAVSRITVNAYERNPEARRKCIEKHGTNCCICGFSFGKAYGNVAMGHIHVHHLHPLSEIGAEYRIDPIKDLRPVCPNCHDVLHLGGECRSIEEVQQLVERNRTVRN